MSKANQAGNGALTFGDEARQAQRVAERDAVKQVLEQTAADRRTLKASPAVMASRHPRKSSIVGHALTVAAKRGWKIEPQSNGTVILRRA